MQSFNDSERHAAASDWPRVDCKLFRYNSVRLSFSGTMAAPEAGCRGMVAVSLSYRPIPAQKPCHLTHCRFLGTGAARRLYVLGSGLRQRIQA